MVVAHPDDETFGCGSVLLHAAAMGITTAVSCATRGEQGGDTHRGTGLGEIREAELREAAALMRVSRVDLLGFRDSGMSGEPPAGSLLGSDEDTVIEAVRSALEAFSPDIVVTLDASDGHRDHIRIRDATVTAAQQAGIGQLYLSCLPRSLMRQWAEVMRHVNLEMEHLDADVAQLGTPDEHITTIIDASEHLATRERAMAVHASQTSPYEGLPDDLRRAFLADVHLQQIVPRPLEGPPVRNLLTGVLL